MIEGPFNEYRRSYFRISSHCFRLLPAVRTESIPRRKNHTQQVYLFSRPVAVRCGIFGVFGGFFLRHWFQRSSSRVQFKLASHATFIDLLLCSISKCCYRNSLVWIKKKKLASLVLFQFVGLIITVQISLIYMSGSHEFNIRQNNR
jgi:hypothetical protein